MNSSADREKPGAVFWATVVLLMSLVVYPLSFGPACWIASRGTNESARLPKCYSPIARMILDEPELAGAAARKFAMLGMPANRTIRVFAGQNRQSLVIDKLPADDDWQVHEGPRLVR